MSIESVDRRSKCHNFFTSKPVLSTGAVVGVALIVLGALTLVGISNASGALGGLGKSVTNLGAGISLGAGGILLVTCTGTLFCCPAKKRKRTEEEDQEFGHSKPGSRQVRIDNGATGASGRETSSKVSTRAVEHPDDK